MLKKMFMLALSLLLLTSLAQARMLYESQVVTLHSLPAESGVENQHPVDANVEQLEALFSRIEVSSKNTDNKLVPLFPGANALAVAKELHTALRHSNADTDLLLIGYRKEGGLLSSKRYASAARVFVKDGALNLIMGKIDQFQSEFRDNFRKLPQVGSRQMPIKEQTGSIEIPGLVKMNKRADWLVLDLSSPLRAKDNRRRGQNRIGYETKTSAPMAVVPSQSNAKVVPSANSPIIEKPTSKIQQLELEFDLLQRLREKGIITEPEYNSKKKELLQRL